MYIVFGYGACGRQCIELLGLENIAYIVDNDGEKRNIKSNPAIYTFEEKKQELKKSDIRIVVAVSAQYQDELIRQLKQEDIINYVLFSDVLSERVRQRVLQRPNYIEVYEKAIQWVKDNTVPDEGIVVSSQYRISYPEVTGYYIPTLLMWGHRESAIQFAKWLCSTQKDDGSWYDAEDNAAYVFDTAQILKGLISIRKLLPEVDIHIQRGCDWILSNACADGRLTTPTTAAWGDTRTCSELIHVYCLSPLCEAGRIFHKDEYERQARHILTYYLTHYREKIENFSLLSHFYAYVIEGLLDMGEIEIATQAMKKIEEIQSDDGNVPGYNDVHWTCSTGLFQLALIWYRLGNLSCGNRAFGYACKLQNSSGGWYGSYVHPDYSKENHTYFPDAEISWAVKFFLDALYYKNVAQFNEQAQEFMTSIDVSDGRYLLIRQEVESVASKGKSQILDVGCGKGRFLERLIHEFPQHEYYGVDLSDKVMTYIKNPNIETQAGSITCLPYPDATFDVVYANEVLEHAIDIRNAIAEMVRVTKTNGKVIFIDKRKEKLGTLEIDECEQWFDEIEVANILEEFCTNVKVISEIFDKDSSQPFLFAGWIGSVLRM